MELTLGTGIFWLLIAGGAAETLVHIAKIRAAKAVPDPEVPALKKRVEELEQRLDQQTDLFLNQEDTIRRLEESAEFMQRLLHGRDAEQLPLARDRPK